MAPALRRPLARLLHRTVSAWAVRGFGGLLVATGLAMPWVAEGLGWWRVEQDAATDTADAGDPTAADTAQPTARKRTKSALRPALVDIAGGTFVMGSPPDEKDRYTDETQHTVTLSGFSMCATEVTQGQFMAVRGALPLGCVTDCGDDMPVLGVSWNDAVAYLDALSLREGLRPCYAGRANAQLAWDTACDGYRLPTEAEWEYAARAGTTTTFSFGDDPREVCAYANAFDELAMLTSHVASRIPVACNDGRINAAPVATYRANPWGLHDMHGNVWEWVWDVYDERYNVDLTRIIKDPRGPSGLGARSVRGGSYVDGARDLRSADRFKELPNNRNILIGFRCVRAG